MAGRSLGLRERRRIETREHVHRVALSAIAQAGFEATTVASISAEAGISESTFFRLFPTKADALLLPYERFAEAVESFEPPEDPATLLISLHRLYREQLSSLSEDDARLTIVLHALVGVDDSLRGAVAMRDRAVRDALNIRIAKTGGGTNRVMAVFVAAATTEAALREAASLPPERVTASTLPHLHEQAIVGLTHLLSQS